MLLLYNALITLLWPLLAFYRPFRGTLLKRLGRFELGGYDPAAPGIKVLINAVSAGEVVAIAPFIRELKRARPECQVVLLTTTESGQTMARDKLGPVVDLLAYFPLIDLPFVVRRYLARLRPDLYITTESELWPNIMNACRRRGIPVALVNARIYLHNKQGWRGWLVRRLYRLVDLIVCQDDRQRNNFRTFGLPDEQLAISGNLKFDFALEPWTAERLAEERLHLGLTDESVIVAGSTHPGEEELLLEALGAVRGAMPDLGALAARLLLTRLIIAPRHADRAAEVLQLASGAGYKAVRLADAAVQAWDVMVVDRYGVLTEMYQLADIVVMGGTFHPKVGGHNILEATILGKPVVIGPYRFSITAQVEMLGRAGGLIQLDQPDQLATNLQALLANPERSQAIGRAAQEVTLANRGAAARAVAAVLGLAPKR